MFCTQRLNVACGGVCDGKSIFLQNLVKEPVLKRLEAG